MSASLVGSEMCIRDSSGAPAACAENRPAARSDHAEHAGPSGPAANRRGRRAQAAPRPRPRCSEGRGPTQCARRQPERRPG
eukprot:10246571-Alexandrium_andersonii.AAC.1